MNSCCKTFAIPNKADSLSENHKISMWKIYYPTRGYWVDVVATFRAIRLHHMHVR